MPARQSTGGGGTPPKKPTVPKSRPASVSSKALPKARQTNKSYGAGPVTVYTAPKANPTTTVRATTRINKAVGAKVLKPVKRMSKADVLVRGAGRNSLPGSQPPKGARKATIRVTPGTTTGRQAVGVRAHELGHSLGLAHPGRKDDPYVQRGSKQKIFGAGMMAGTRDNGGPSINRSEVRRIRRLRGLKNAEAGVPAIVPPKKAQKAKARKNAQLTSAVPIRRGENQPHGHPKPAARSAIREVRKGNYKPAVSIVKKAWSNPNTPPALARKSARLVSSKKYGKKIVRKAIKKLNS